MRAPASPSARSSRASRRTRPKRTCALRRPASVRRARRCSGSPRRRSARGRCWRPPSARPRGRRRSFDAGAVPDQQRDEASDRLRVARAELDRVLAQRSEATRGIDVAAGGAEQRRVAMVRATLLAPFDGLVTRRLREPGDTVTVGSTVLRIVDTNRVYVNAAVDETMLPLLAVGSARRDLLSGRGCAVMGRVTRISWEADRQTHELLVEVTPERLERRVAIGQRADVRVEVARREQVPARPGPHDPPRRHGRLRVRRPRRQDRPGPPTARPHGARSVEVLEGLAEGDAVWRRPVRPRRCRSGGAGWHHEPGAPRRPQAPRPVRRHRRGARPPAERRRRDAGHLRRDGG
jgi:hypothetical protein